jgi:two-component system LytT family response regulator
MRVLIVDDEPLARTALVDILTKRGDVEEVDVAQDAPRALDLLQRHQYDVFLLDIRMPEMSGLELADCLSKQKSPSPAVVFVTAHQEHAVAAFEKRAIDYILKPFTAKRVWEALDVAVSRSAQERASRLLDFLTRREAVNGQPLRIAIKAKGRILFIEPAQVVMAEANGNYVLLHQMCGSYLLRESISALTEKLEPYGFIRIHRSALINSAFVESLEPAGDEYILTLKTGKEYTVSRTYKKNLKSLAKFWIGTDGF